MNGGRPATEREYTITVSVSRTRFLAAVFSASVVLAVAGIAWDAARFGWGEAGQLAHLQNEITRRVTELGRAVETTAVRVSRQSDLVAAAAASPDKLPALFAELGRPVAADLNFVTATVWVSPGPTAGYRAIAWTAGPAQNVAADDLARAPGLIVVTGAGGLRLMFLQPILLAASDRDGQRVGVVAAEAALSAPSAAGSLVQRFVMASSVGPVDVARSDGSTSSSGTRFTVTSPAGEPLVDVTVAPDQIAHSRRVFRLRVLAVCLLPWISVLALALSELVNRRQRAPTPAGWWGWTSVVSLVILATAGGAAWLAQRANFGTVWGDAFLALAAVAIAAMAPGQAWQRTRPLPATRRGRGRFLVEHFLGGGFVAVAFLTTEWLWRNRISPASIDQWHVPVLPSDVTTATGLAALLLAQVAVSWAAASVIGILAARWRISWRRPASAVAVVLWTAPAAAALIAVLPVPTWPLTGVVALAGSAIVFGLAANAIRRHVRHTSEAQRLVLQFAALLVPILAAYPLAAASAERATRDVIEREYAPATQEAQQPDRLRSGLAAASADIDAIGELPDLLREAGTSVNSTKLAFHIWNRSSLSVNRVTSQIELYGPSRELVSHFSLNVPEFGALSRTAEQKWTGTGCEWDAFAEVARFGAGERRMLQAERALCGAAGEFLGAVTIRIIPDYRTLPFVTSANPYYDALGTDETQDSGSRVPELQVVVYGWGLQPAFVSGRVIWPVDDELFGRLYASRDPFWIDRELEGRTYHVYFLNDRGGIYALGYPGPTLLQHATRIAESAALLLLLFAAYLAATVALAPIVRRRTAPLGRLFKEIRASFYRKLFLFFVVAAVGPVVLFAIAFGTYMTNRLRADVESEASNVVLMAKRVLDEVSAARATAGQTRPAPDDDVMTLIRQMVDQDVNLFEGPELRATSQRDLFTSGLLPTRTPAEVYRRITLDRRPVLVIEDSIGAFTYQVAAAPVPTLGRDAVLTVPLASRQREIERQIDELTQGVLTGAVVLVFFAAALGASVAARVSDPVARLSRATRLVAAGRFDERLTADTADELGRLVADFNTMTEMLVAQRAELARANQLKAWAEMARQVAHEIKNPLTPIQLAAEHLQRVHDDANRPMGPVVERCLTTILSQVRLLRQIASEFSTFAGTPTPRFDTVDVARLIDELVLPYRTSLPAGIRIDVASDARVPAIRSDRTLLARALTNLVENALQAMPGGGQITIQTAARADSVEIRVIDTGVGMDREAVARAFEPYFSTKTGGSGLGLANAQRNVEMCGGTIALTSQPGEGTTVTVTLPVEPRGAPASA